MKLYLKEWIAGQVWSGGHSLKENVCREWGHGRSPAGWGCPTGRVDMGQPHFCICAFRDQTIPLTDVTTEKKRPEHLSEPQLTDLGGQADCVVPLSPLPSNHPRNDKQI